MKKLLVIALALVLGQCTAVAQAPKPRTGGAVTKLAGTPAHAIAGTTATAQILVDEKLVGKTKASLTFIEIPSGGQWMRPSTQGTAIVYVRKGRAKLDAGAITEGDVAVLPDGSAHPMRASMRTELLVLATPPGGEQAYRAGAAMGAAGTGPEPRIMERNSSEKVDILDGKGEVWMMLQKDKAYVGVIRVRAGTTVPEHTHAGEAELLYITEGKGEMTIDGQRFPLEPFVAVHVPAGARHSVKVSPDTHMQAIQFYAPSGPEQRWKGGK